MEYGGSNSHARKIILTRSEPLVNLKKLREISGFNALQTALYQRNRDFQIPPRNVHPPTSPRTKMTIVSPKRRIRIPQKTVHALPRSNADGESAYSTDEEKALNALKLRLPGDGCNSDSEPETEDDSDLSTVDGFEILASTETLDKGEACNNDNVFEGTYIIYNYNVLQPFKYSGKVAYPRHHCI